jgi:hypothetical protein
VNPPSRGILSSKRFGARLFVPVLVPVARTEPLHGAQLVPTARIADAALDTHGIGPAQFLDRFSHALLAAVGAPPRQHLTASLIQQSRRTCSSVSMRTCDDSAVTVPDLAPRTTRSDAMLGRAIHSA